MEEDKLKPVVFVQGINKFYAPNYYAQNLLLKAMSKGVTDPNELKKMAGLKATADVFRTLDKMAIRKEYHNALEKNGISLDYLVTNLKGIIDGEASDTTKLASLNILLKSIGLDKYEKEEVSAKGWEDAVLTAVSKEEEKIKELGESSINAIEGSVEDYDVVVPVMPDKEKDEFKIESDLGKELYGE
jgi:hypothetical protein